MLNSIKNELKILEETRDNIRQAILDRGVIMPEGTSFDDYDDYIRKISIYKQQINHMDNLRIITDNWTNMNGLFENCPEDVKSIDFSYSKINTSNVTNMGRMFVGCSNLETIKFGSNWNTSNVIYMHAMFSGCSSLTELDLSNWNTSNVTDMRAMFGGCSSLTELDLSNWNTSNVKECYNMFNGCSSLTELDLSSWDTSNVKECYNVFEGCIQLQKVDLSNWNLSNASIVSQLFYTCDISELRLDNCNTDTISRILRDFPYSANTNIYVKKENVEGKVSCPENSQFIYV